MSRQQFSEFVQDRLGNVNRKLDDYRSLDGMSTDNGITDQSTTAGSTDTAATDQYVVYTNPDGVTGAILEEFIIDNNSSDDANNNLAITFTIIEITLNSNGTIDSTTQRSVTQSVAADTRSTVDYSGEPFKADAIGIDAATGVQGSGNTSTLDVEVGASVRAIAPEDVEEGAQITTSP